MFFYSALDVEARKRRLELLGKEDVAKECVTIVLDGLFETLLKRLGGRREVVVLGERRPKCHVATTGYVQAQGIGHGDFVMLPFD